MITDEQQDQLNRLQAQLQSNENFISLGYEACKRMMVENIVAEKRAILNTQFDFSIMKEHIYNDVLREQVGMFEAQNKAREQANLPQMVDEDPAPAAEEMKSPKLKKQ